MNKTLLKDAFFATVSVFLTALILKKIIFLHFGFLDPVHAAVHHVKEEFENLITDMGSGKITANRAPASEIYLVNIDTLKRADIALLLRKIEKWKPKVIAVDAVFNDSTAKLDTSLINALKSISGKLVTGTSYPVNRTGEIIDKIEKSMSPYQYGKEGYTNFVSASATDVVRSFLPVKYNSDGEKVSEVPSFALAIVEKYDSLSYMSLLEHRKYLEDSTPEIIVYSHSNAEYAIASPTDILGDNLSFPEFENKIVLLGYIGQSEDLHYSSFNPNGSHPDMNGVMIHANIVDMILAKDYIKRANDYVVLGISFLICFLMMLFFIVQFVKYHLWFHIVFKLVQFASAVIIFAFGLLLFNSLQIQVNTLLIIGPIALAVDILYFYDSFVQWLHRRFGYKTYFQSSHGH